MVYNLVGCSLEVYSLAVVQQKTHLQKIIMILEVLAQEKLKIRYCDENFVEHIEVFEGYVARVIQHEYDHLDGKLFIDHLSPIRKQLIKSKLNNIIRGKARCDYRTKSVNAKR